MKKAGFGLLTLFILVSIKWQPNLEAAEKIAHEKHELILLNFSGSDWCGPCIRLHTEIFESDVFTKMADTSLVMINADFPRSRKHQLSPEMQKRNDSLADRYNPDGKFPYTLLLDADGNVIKTWEGLPDESAGQFASEISAVCDGRR